MSDQTSGGPFGRGDDGTAVPSVPNLPPTPPPPPGALGGSAPPTASNGLAVAALVLGIIGLVLFFTIWGGIILGILAIIFGAIGLGKAKQGAPYKGLATAGLVLGILAVLSSFLFIAFIVSVADDTGVFDEIERQIQYCLDHPNAPDC